MKLFQVIANAQGGQAFANMGKAYGVSEDVVAQTVRYFLPPIAKALEKRAQSPVGLLSVLEFIGSRRYDRFLNDVRIFGHAKAVSEGERILSYLFVSPQRIQKIVENRSKVLPLDAEKLREMLPLIAVLAMGATENRTRKPLAMILERLTSTSVDAAMVANPYVLLAQQLRKQERDEKERGKRRLFAFFGSSNTASANNSNDKSVPEALAQAG